eukprot:1128098-Prymnesium_polylepis.1
MRDPAALFGQIFAAKTEKVLGAKNNAVIQWHREPDVQQLCLKMISQRLLHTMPLFRTYAEAPDVYFKDDITSFTFKFSRVVRLH